MKIIKPTLGIITITIALSSCSTIHKYERPNVYTIEKYKNQINQEDTTSIAKYNIDELIDDEILKQYIEKGLQQNINLLQTIELVKQAGAYLKKGKANLFPSLSTNGTYTRANPSLMIKQNRLLSERYDYYNLNLNGTLSWEIDVWGKLRSQKRAYANAFLRSEQARLLSQSQLIASIASTYYKLLAADARVLLLKQNIENSKNSIETAKVLKEAGTLTEVAVKQYQSQLYDRELLLVDQLLNVEQQENALCILLGKTPQSLKRASIKDQKLLMNMNIGIPMQLLDNRPDVMSAEFALVNALEMSNVARTNMYPSFSITATGGFNSDSFDNWLKPNALFSNLIGKLTQPIFNQRNLKTQKEIKESEQQIAYWEYKKTILTAYQEVVNLMSSLDTYEMKEDMLKDQSDLLQTTIEYSEILQAQGMIDYLEVITAKEKELNARLNMIDNKTNKLITVITLYRALGGGK